MRSILICVSIASLLLVGCDDTRSAQSYVKPYCEFIQYCWGQENQIDGADCEESLLQTADYHEADGCGEAYARQLACFLSFSTCAEADGIGEGDATDPCLAEHDALYKDCYGEDEDDYAF